MSLSLNSEWDKLFLITYPIQPHHRLVLCVNASLEPSASLIPVALPVGQT
jgi:hypothetical protein